MNKGLRLLTSLGVSLLAVLATSCSSINITATDEDFPVPRGEEVTLTNEEFLSRIYRITHTEKEGITFFNSPVLNYRYMTNDKLSYETTITEKEYVNLSTQERDLRFSMHFAQPPGEATYDFTLNALKNATYFTLDTNTNKKFSTDESMAMYEDFNLQYINGKYKITKPITNENGTFTFNDFLNAYRFLYARELEYPEIFYMQPFYALGSIRGELKKMHADSFKALKLYENDEYFTVQLKVSLNEITAEHLNTYRYLDFTKKGLTEMWLYEQYTKLEIEAIFVIKHNDVVEFGLKDERIVEIETGANEITEITLEHNYIAKFFSKMPEKWDFKEYKEISSFNETKPSLKTPAERQLTL